MDPVLIISGLGAISGWVALFIQQKTIISTEEKEAIEAIYKAVNHTRIYLKRKETEGRDLKEEQNLSDLWVNIHSALHSIDQELAERCIIKSGYWSDPDRWTASQIKKADIALNSIDKDLKSVIRK